MNPAVPLILGIIIALFSFRVDKVFSEEEYTTVQLTCKKYDWVYDTDQGEVKPWCYYICPDVPDAIIPEKC